MLFDLVIDIAHEVKRAISEFVKLINLSLNTALEVLEFLAVLKSEWPIEFFIQSFGNLCL